MPASMYRLAFQSHTVARPPVTGDTAGLLIGRDAACGLRLTDAGVQDRHATIDCRADGYFIRDLTTSAGVHVNGTAVTDQRLTTGDEIEIGSVRFTFEVVHQPPPDRRTFDPWQFLGAGIIAALVVGQLALFVWIFTQPHPRHARTDFTANQPTPSPTPVAPTNTPALLPLTTGTTSTPEVLSRMIKIIRADRPDTGTLRLLIKAQVGDRQLDPKAIAISVQCSPAAIQWLTIPATWENFKTKELSIRLPEPCPGCIVRTYYRNQPQDSATIP